MADQTQDGRPLAVLTFEDRSIRRHFPVLDSREQVEDLSRELNNCVTFCLRSS
jgi:hypothetical protein